ncbi:MULTISPECIES: hypothetical protein [Leeuwenhoekiella]|uniref:hypothetical protein n=1 Tax=Leeuwenhoekiella TaxID=283735 RepID=UPI000C4073C0|nr:MULTISPECIES: hypothetical protein [Leeuwenhoekiella]MAO41934.1 hypothetical protein [Leeuwenhoekiella sp.]|tara:strand:- start:851 stop:2560 length:1710 start_codon:yes stop_codon:yes gene_type:complete
MTPQLQLPSPFALHEALEPLTEALLQTAPVEALYLSAIRQTPDAIYNLLIVVQEAGALADLQQQIPVLQVQFPLVRMQVYTPKQLQGLEQEGSVYGLWGYHLGERIYPRPAADTFKNPSERQLEQLHLKAQQQLEQDAACICKGFDTAAYWFERKDYAASVLALVEVFKTCLSVASKRYTGRVMEYPSLEAQLAVVRPFLPQLGKLFPTPEAPDADPTLLELLDVWSVEGIPSDEAIDRHTCYQIQMRMERVFTVVDTAARELLEACSPKPTPAASFSQAGATQSPLEQALQEAINYLRETYRVHSAYLLYSAQDSRVQSAHCFTPTETQVHQSTAVVLLVTYTSVGVSPSQLTDRVYNQTGRRIRICFILETVKRAHKALDFGSNFLQKALGEGKPLYAEDDQLCRFLKQGYLYHPQQVEKLKKYWDIRSNRAYYLIESTRILDTREDALVQLHMYEEALIQTCLGLIRLFWEYSPAYTSLNYLLALCRSFTAFPGALLETTSFKARRRLHLLSHGQQHLRYGSTYTVTDTDANEAYHLCVRFMQQAEALAAERLQFFKRKAYQREVD